jgi:hypothetical protein
MNKTLKTAAVALALLISTTGCADRMARNENMRLASDKMTSMCQDGDVEACKWVLTGGKGEAIARSAGAMLEFG